jgi:8-oxo-dGTP diphosphatase
MEALESKIKSIYGEKLRVRVCGICIENNKLLLIHHKGLTETGSLWAPPGGGMEYGEDAKSALQREFTEETGLEVEVDQFLFVHEYLDPPLHGIELFFEVKICAGVLKKGFDPEMDTKSQIITQTIFMPFEEIKKIPSASLHYVIQNITSFEAILKLRGYFKFC